MMNYRREYEKAMATNGEDFNVTEKEFKAWLEESGNYAGFEKQIKNICSEEDYYYIALDYSIPVSMVKYFEIKQCVA